MDENIILEVTQNVIVIGLGLICIDIGVMIIDKILHYICTAFDKLNMDDLKWKLKKVEK